jgi:hypothetical protein
MVEAIVASAVKSVALVPLPRDSRYWNAPSDDELWLMEPDTDFQVPESLLFEMLVEI